MSARRDLAEASAVRAVRAVRAAEQVQRLTPLVLELAVLVSARQVHHRKAQEVHPHLKEARGTLPRRLRLLREASQDTHRRPHLTALTLEAPTPSSLIASLAVQETGCRLETASQALRPRRGTGRPQSPATALTAP